MATKDQTLHRNKNISIPISMNIVFERFKQELGFRQSGDSYAAQKLLYLAMINHMSGPDVDIMKQVFEGKMAHKEQYINEK